MAQTKNILLLGSGYVALPAAEFLARKSENKITVGCRTLAKAEELANKLKNASAVSIDVTDPTALEPLVAKFDLVISLVPYIYHAGIIEAAIKGKTNVVTTSYLSDATRALDQKCKDAGITVMNEIGLDPGIDHLYAIKTIDEVHEAGGKITSFLSYCGGLPAPEAADNPLGYAFSWSSRGVLLALRNSASYLSGGKRVSISGPQLMEAAKPYFISPAFAFVAYPNRDSVPFTEYYNIPEAKTCIRGTLRYQGFPQFIDALVKTNFLDDTPRDYLKTDGAALSWLEVTARTTGCSEITEAAVVEKIKSLAGFPSEAEEERIISGMRWFGMFSKDPVTPRGNSLDTLCATLEKLLVYGPEERDMVILQHKFGIENKDGTTETRTSTLLDFGVPGGYSSMAKLVGIPCGIACQQTLDGVLSRKGVFGPYDKEICEPLRVALEAEGICLVEKTI